VRATVAPAPAAGQPGEGTPDCEQRQYEPARDALTLSSPLLRFAVSGTRTSSDVPQINGSHRALSLKSAP
jgi:hypothetical protein